EPPPGRTSAPAGHADFTMRRILARALVARCIEDTTSRPRATVRPGGCEALISSIQLNRQGHLRSAPSRCKWIEVRMRRRRYWLGPHMRNKYRFTIKLLRVRYS